MPFARVRIERLEAIDAPHTVTSAAMEDDLAAVYQRLGIPARCMESLTGISERRFWPEGTEVASAALQACEACLADTQFASRDSRAGIGAVLSTSVSKEYLEPSVAALVHGDLGLAPECLNFDLSNACLGFLSSMTLAGELIEAGRLDFALVVAAESSRNVVSRTVERLKEPSSTMEDYKSFLPTLTLGSGAVAALLARDDVATSEHRFLGSVSLAATEHNRICMGTYEWMRTDAPKLLIEGVALAKRTYAKAREVFGWTGPELAQLICHQVGAGHLATVTKALELPVERAFQTYPTFGNVGSAALPFTLKKAVDAGRVQSGDRVALMGIGSGLNCSMGEVIW